VDQLLLHKVHKGVLDARRLSQQFRAQVRRTVHTRSNPGPTVQASVPACLQVNYATAQPCLLPSMLLLLPFTAAALTLMRVADLNAHGR